MNPVEFDRLIARARNPRLIPGIYNYCDGRCPRCPFTDRCLTFQDNQEMPAASDDDHRASGSVANRVGESLRRTLDMLTEVGRRAGMDLSKLGKDDHAANVRQAFEHHYDDPLVSRSRDYARLAYPISQALGPVVAARGDQRLKDAVDTIGWFSTLISSKLFRAVAGRPAAEIVDGEGDGQQDYDGSAKVALIGIAESRAAWRMLMERGKATADGVPARAVQMLDALEADVRSTFPRAMTFVRPGFDDPECRG